MTKHILPAFLCRTDAMDWPIDRVVYELYGLTEEEIRIVEEGTK